MHKKIKLSELKITSFVTKDIYGGIKVCGVTLCPPCTADERACAATETVCPGCVDTQNCSDDGRGCVITVQPL